MSPGLRTKALLAAGLVVCAVVLAERMLDLQHSVASLRASAIALGPNSGPVQTPAERGSLRERRSSESSFGDLFGTRKPDPVPETKLIKPADPPAPPAFPYRYFGRVQAKHFLERDGQLVPIEAGTLLQDGFEVLAIDERQVLARHKATGLPVTVSRPTLRE